MQSYWLRKFYSALHPPFQTLGSFANLDIGGIPEAADGFRIVREWVQYTCLDLQDIPSGPVDRFRQWFTVACTLAFDLDRENAQAFVPCAPMYESTLWPQSPSSEVGVLVVQDFVEFLTAKAYHSLDSGLSYLRWVSRWDAWVLLHPF